jgi:hypothetical protein
MRLQSAAMLLPDSSRPPGVLSNKKRTCEEKFHIREYGRVISSGICSRKPIHHHGAGRP